MQQIFQILLGIRDHNEVLIENENEVSILCFEYNNNDDNKLKMI